MSGNGFANLKIAGGQLRYNSGNGQNLADGDFSLTYSGSPGFLADFSGNTGLTIHLTTHNNPGSALPTTFQVELTS